MMLAIRISRKKRPESPQTVKQDRVCEIASVHRDGINEVDVVETQNVRGDRVSKGLVRP